MKAAFAMYKMNLDFKYSHPSLYKVVSYIYSNSNRWLLALLENGNVMYWQGIIIGMGFVFLTATGSILTHHSLNMAHNQAMGIRSLMTALLYRKVLFKDPYYREAKLSRFYRVFAKGYSKANFAQQFGLLSITRPSTQLHSFEIMIEL